jgi:hypothetical protein
MSWPSGTFITAALGLAIAVNDLRPSINPEEDPPHREYVEICATGALSGVGSTSGNMTWPGNSTDAVNIAVRNRYAVRLDAVRAITVSSTFSGPDDL